MRELAELARAGASDDAARGMAAATEARGDAGALWDRGSLRGARGGTPELDQRSLLI